MTDTRTKILDVATKLFAQNGFSGTSLRSITAEAGTNLASIHYHFGSKEELIQTLVARIIDPLNEERASILDEIEAKYAPETPPLEQIIEAFLKPMISLKLRDMKGERTILKLLGRLHTESEDMKNEFINRMKDTAFRFLELLKLALPHLSEVEVFWRFNFMIGTAIACTHSNEGIIKTFMKCNETDCIENLLDRLTPFLVAGFMAPAPKTQHVGENNAKV